MYLSFVHLMPPTSQVEAVPLFYLPFGIRPNPNKNIFRKHLFSRSWLNIKVPPGPSSLCMWPFVWYFWSLCINPCWQHAWCFVPWGYLACFSGIVLLPHRNLIWLRCGWIQRLYCISHSHPFLSSALPSLAWNSNQHLPRGRKEVRDSTKLTRLQCRHFQRRVLVLPTFPANRVGGNPNSTKNYDLSCWFCFHSWNWWVMRPRNLLGR